MAACDALGLGTAETVLALGQWQVPDGRGKRFAIRIGSGGTDTIDLIDESYNANPTSMEAAFDVLAHANPRDGLGRNHKGKRVAFLGDMLELGPDEVAMHADLANSQTLKSIDTIHTAGPMMAALHAALPIEKQGQCCDDAVELAAQAHDLLDAGDVVMVKGSNGSKISTVAGAIRALSRDKTK